MQISPVRLSQYTINFPHINNNSRGYLGAPKQDEFISFKRKYKQNDVQNLTKLKDWGYMEDNYPEGYPKEGEYTLRDFCEQEIDFFERNKDLTLTNKGNLCKDLDKRLFDIGKLVAVAADNSIRKEGNSYIFTGKMPKMFDGLKQEDVAESITEAFLDNKIRTENKAIEIGGKKFEIGFHDAGQVGEIFWIKDEKGNKAALKYLYSDFSAVNNGKCEIALSEQMTRDGVGDVPKFYMANAADYTVKDGITYKMPQWMMTDFIEDNQPARCEKTTWKKWLENYHLIDNDATKQNMKGEYLVDLGGICHLEHEPFPRVRHNGYFLTKYGMLKGLGVNGMIEYYKKKIEDMEDIK